MRAAILRPMTEILTGCSGTLEQSAVHAILYSTALLLVNGASPQGYLT